MGWGWPPKWAGMINLSAAPLLCNLHTGKVYGLALVCHFLAT